MKIYEFLIDFLQPSFLPCSSCANSFVSVRVKVPARDRHDAFLLLEHCFGSEIARTAVLLRS